MLTSVDQAVEEGELRAQLPSSVSEHLAVNCIKEYSTAMFNLDHVLMWCGMITTVKLINTSVILHRHILVCGGNS